MHRGTTPVLAFKLETDLNFEDITEMWVTIRDEHRAEQNFTLTDVELDDVAKTVYLPLTQENTLGMYGETAAQIRILTADGKAYVTDKVTFRVEGIMKGGVIGGE